MVRAATRSSSQEVWCKMIDTETTRENQIYVDVTMSIRGESPHIFELSPVRLGMGITTYAEDDEELQNSSNRQPRHPANLSTLATCTRGGFLSQFFFNIFAHAWSGLFARHSEL